MNRRLFSSRIVMAPWIIHSGVLMPIAVEDVAWRRWKNSVRLENDDILYACNKDPFAMARQFGLPNRVKSMVLNGVMDGVPGRMDSGIFSPARLLGCCGLSADTVEWVDKVAKGYEEECWAVIYNTSNDGTIWQSLGEDVKNIVDERERHSETDI